MRIVLQYKILYCDLEAAREVKVYCKRWLDCIAAWRGNCIARIALYCNKKFVLQKKRTWG